MGYDYLIQSDYWPKYHSQHSPSVSSSVKSSFWANFSLCFIKIPQLSLQCSLQFSPKIPGKSIQSPGGDFCSSTHCLTCVVTSLTANRENNWAAQVVEHSCICRPNCILNFQWQWELVASLIVWLLGLWGNYWGGEHRGSLRGSGGLLNPIVAMAKMHVGN